MNRITYAETKNYKAFRHADIEITCTARKFTFYFQQIAMTPFQDQISSNES